MIYVKRTHRPEGLVEEQEKVKRAAEQWVKDGNDIKDFEFDFKAYKKKDVVNALTAMFHGKCAYCESRYAGTQPVDIEHWRPKGAVKVRINNKYVTWPGYYWLAAEWTNLLPSCIDCNRLRWQQDARVGKRVRAGKANRFPVKDNKNLTQPARSEKGKCPHELDDDNRGGDEVPLLLNPCEEEPSDHLAFESDTAVVLARTVEGSRSKGENSIAVYGLNRSGLVLERKEVLRAIQQRFKTIKRLIDLLVGGGELPDLSDELREIVLDLVRYEVDALMQMKEPERPYSALATQVIDSLAISNKFKPAN